MKGTDKQNSDQIRDLIKAQVREASDYYRKRKNNHDLAAATDDEDDFLRCCYDEFVFDGGG